jgi:hypothetical protein
MIGSLRTREGKWILSSTREGIFWWIGVLLLLLVLGMLLVMVRNNSLLRTLHV